MAGRNPFRALSHRNIRLFFVGQTLSLVGTWTQSTAMLWLISGLTSRPLVAGMIGFAAQLPGLIVPPFAGVISDRSDRRKVLFTTQTFAMLQALSLAFLVYYGKVQLWHVLFLNMMLSAINAVDLTARQTFLGDLLDRKDDLISAIALNSSVVNGARLVGPALAGYLMATVGASGCFFTNALSFLAVLAALAAMRFPPRERNVQRRAIWNDLREGWGAVTASRPIRAVLLLVAMVSLVGLPYPLILPYFTRDALSGDESTYGMLMTMPGAGALAAGLLGATRGLRGLVRRILLAPFISGAALMLMMFSRSVPLTGLLLFIAGFGFLMLLNSGNILLQTIAPEQQRGRVISYYSIAFTGMAPFGNLLVPGIAQMVGFPGAFLSAGIMCVAGGVTFAIISRGWRHELQCQLKQIERRDGDQLEQPPSDKIGEPGT